MDENMITRRDIEQAKLDIISELSARIEARVEKGREEEILTQAQVCEILDICPKQFKVIRDRRQITFYQYGRKIYVKRSDLRTFLEEYTIHRRERRRKDEES